MKRAVVAFAAAVAATCTIGQPPVATKPQSPTDLAGPPPLEVRVGERPVAVLRGSACWTVEAKGESHCADTPAPPELARTLDPAPVEPEASLHLSFPQPPILETLAVSLWKGRTPVPVDVTGEHAVIAPKAAGTYVYSVFARWPEGDATHVFRIDVRRPARTD